jgi:hypothetical protein
MKKRATLVMKEVLGEAEPERQSNSNPQLLSPKVDNLDSDNASHKSGDTPRMIAAKKRRAGSAQRSSKNNFVSDVDKVKAYIQPQI